MSETFFENPVYVYIALAVAELVLFIIWRETRTRKAALCLLIPPLLAVVIGLIAHFVVTDHEAEFLFYTHNEFQQAYRVHSVAVDE